MSDTTGGFVLALLACAVAVGYVARMVRPARRLLDWAESQFEGDGWGRWYRRWAAAAILTAALAVHPLRTRRAWIDNRARQHEPTVFSGAMKPKYNPDWSKTEETDHA
jgi:hypothetical protein